MDWKEIEKLHPRSKKQVLIKWKYISMELKINWDHKRCKHAIERMWLRGVSVDEVKQGILKGSKVKQTETNLIESFYRYYSIVYDEEIYKKEKIRKVYPVTVKLW